MSATDNKRQLRPGILILTARMGAGHDGVARELSERVRALGFNATVADVWDLQPPGAGRLVTAFYRFMIRRAPWLYEVIYRIWLRPPPAHRRAPLSPVTRWAERRLLRQVAETEPVAVVTTFHLGTQMLGNLRARGALRIPAISYCVDLAAHGLWVNPGVDANLCLHPTQAARLAQQGARGLHFTGPLVPDRFRPLPQRRAASRAALGVGPHEKLVLVVSGSWGAGRIEGTLEALRSIGGHRVAVVTGNNPALYRRLRQDHPDVVVLGWVDRMEDVLAAADVVVENAGGLSAMEALAAEVPLISYLPIPGHGRQNVRAMAEAGISVYAESEAELAAGLAELTVDSPRRRRLLQAARAMTTPDPLRALCDIVGGAPMGGLRAAGARVRSDASGGRAPYAGAVVPMLRRPETKARA